MTCVGFGKTEGKCENEAGSRHSSHWCESCDKARIEHISRRLDAISETFAVAGGREPTP